MRRLASVVLTGVLLTACGGDPFAPEGVSGLYLLETVNGSPLPYSQTVTQNGVTFTASITAGSVSLNGNSTWSGSITTNFTIEGTTTTETGTLSGTFELVAPSAIRLTGFRDGEITSGTLDGDRLTLILDGDSFVFRR